MLTVAVSRTGLCRGENRENVRRSWRTRKKTARLAGRFQVTIRFPDARTLKSGRSSEKLHFSEFALLNLT
ncbi:MAG TPA: hypothetical protein DE312_01120 [Gallionella sp.]|nr:MAG: hypothetical protein A2Z87_02815 [Gallionellales bacterium GWA2_54_124]OGT19342.1 MAG: hypothetical protein A2522_02245 [Gallionellales bacterium RIFOXYD12_FULL_53_10]OGT40070.1 MAG: hypothetical protein A3K00_05595 [Gallionellales bacterium RIFOXYD2_FULL_52_7]HCI51925.1 hypothetical protein [Gallionella sp.]